MNRSPYARIVKTSQILGLVAFLLALGTGAFAANRCDDLFADRNRVQVFEASKNLSQRLRDNDPHYWQFSRAEDTNYFGDLTAYKGWVFGDSHLGNYLFAPLNGRMRFFFADIKDAGNHVPFIDDFARLVLTTEAVVIRGIERDAERPIKNKEIKKSTRKLAEMMLDAYIKGLNDEKMDRPDSIETIYAETVAEYRIKEREYVVRKTVGDRFKLKSGKIEPIAFENKDPDLYQKFKSDIQAAASAAYPGAQVLDLAYRPRDRGGSHNLDRYWALTKLKGQNEIIEFKMIGEPATSNYQKQPAAKVRYAMAEKFLWPSRDPEHGVVFVLGKQYEMRRKKIDVFRVPYKQKSKDDLDELKDLAVWSAYQHGVHHGKQLKGSKFPNQLTSQFSDVVDELVSFTRDYIDKIENDVSHATPSDEGNNHDD